MKNSINPNKIEKILNELINSQKSEEISNRIDSIKEKYLTKKIKVASNTEFNNEISSFVQRVYAEALQPPRILSKKIALAEAIWLLDAGYKSDGVAGYYAALIDATNSCDDKLGFIIHSIAGTIINIELYRYTEWLFSSIIHPTDACLHREIIGYLIEKNESTPPSDIRKENLSCFLKYYREFIEAYISTENLLNKITSSNNFNI